MLGVPHKSRPSKVEKESMPLTTCASQPSRPDFLGNVHCSSKR